MTTDKQAADLAARAEEAAGELMRSASLEMSAHRPGDAARIAEVLPALTTVTINHLPRHSLEETLAAMRALREAGLNPVPHLAAKRFASRGEAAGFLRRAVDEADVTRVLLIGGDIPKAQGPFGDSTAMLRSEVIAEAGIRDLVLPGYPEGHPVIPTDALQRGLAENLGIARAHGMNVSLLTQFSFAPRRIAEYGAEIARSHPGLPVIVGLAGPTNPLKLLQFAQKCGVSASLRALQAQGMQAVRLLLHTDPTEQLVAIARHVASGALGNVAGVHVFSFGGVAAAAEWINGRLRGG